MIILANCITITVSVYHHWAAELLFHLSNIPLYKIQVCKYFASNVFQLLKQVNRFSVLNGEKDWPKNAPLWYSTPQRFLLHHLSPVTYMPSCTQKFEQTCKRTNHIAWSSSRTCINFNHTSKLITT